VSKDNEQRATRYRHKGKGPERRSLAEQQREVEKVLGTASPQGKLVTGVLRLLDEYEVEQRAARERETEARATLAHEVATTYDAERAAGELTLAEVGRIRNAYKLAEEATPRLIIEAHEQEGRNATEIARELDVSPSYVSRVLRDHKAAAEK
jgi:DNA-directed RNA polymerase specialized sigma subunit